MKSLGYACILSVFCSPIAFAMPVVVDSLANFNTAIGGAPTATYTFPVDVASAPMHDFGAFSTTMSSPVADTIHRVTGQRLLFQIDGPGAAVDTRMTMNFDQPVYGLAFEQVGIEYIDISIDGGVTFFDIFVGSGGGADAFFGIVNLSAFSSVIFEINPPGVGDGGFIDNLVYTTDPAPNVPMPEPASGLLLLTGLLGLRAMRRKGARG